MAALQEYPGRSLSQISERSSIPGGYRDTQDWAITQQFKHVGIICLMSSCVMGPFKGKLKYGHIRQVVTK